MAKIKNDKYYTSPDLARYCVEKTKEIIGEENITEWLEPSGGNGVFLDYLPNGTYSCDIEPEDSRVEKQDYLELNLEHKAGRCIIGNPPFGTRNTLSVKFYKKSIQLGDYIAFILPVSQLCNNIQMYEFDMIHSEDLGKKEYTGVVVHCCFNIYRRNPSGNNKKPNYKLKDVKLTEYRSSKQSIESTNNHDYRFCHWGNAVGTEVTERGRFAHEMGVDILNDSYKENVLTVLKEVDWYKVVKFTATPALYQWQIYKYLKEQIPELE